MTAQKVTWSSSGHTWNTATEHVWDSYTTDISELNISETLNVSEEMVRADVMYVVTQRYKPLSLVDDVSFSGLQISAIFEESLVLIDSPRWGYHITLDQPLSLVDHKVQDFELELYESLQILDTYLGEASFIKSLSESLRILDISNRHPSITVPAESINITDEFYRPSTGIISDVSWYSKPLSDREFESLVLQGAKDGYGRYTTFLQGEYIYQDASIRTRVFNNSPNLRAELEQLVIQADMPDVIDSGTGVINAVTTDPVTPGITVTADTGLNILYNRMFYIDEPHISVLPKGAVGDTKVLTPVISQISFDQTTLEWNKGFNVKLLDTSTGQYKLGTFTWSARGY